MPTHQWILLSLVGLMLIAGCSDQYPPVSGKVVASGQPVAGVKVCFNPVSTRDNPFPGPYAEAITDDSGNYTLVTRGGSAGATPGENVVELYSMASVELGFQESQIEVQLARATANQDRSAFQIAAATKKKIVALRAASGDRLTPTVTTRFTVPTAGTDSANFDLVELTPTTSH